MFNGLSVNVFAQKQDASAAVKEFYRFHFKNEDILNASEVARRRRFFSPRLGRLKKMSKKFKTGCAKAGKNKNYL